MGGLALAAEWRAAAAERDKMSERAAAIAQALGVADRAAAEAERNDPPYELAKAAKRTAEAAAMAGNFDLARAYQKAADAASKAPSHESRAVSHEKDIARWTVELAGKMSHIIPGAEQHAAEEWASAYAAWQAVAAAERAAAGHAQPDSGRAAAEERAVTAEKRAVDIAVEVHAAWKRAAVGWATMGDYGRASYADEQADNAARAYQISMPG